MINSFININKKENWHQSVNKQCFVCIINNKPVIFINTTTKYIFLNKNTINKLFLLILDNYVRNNIKLSNYGVIKQKFTLPFLLSLEILFKVNMV